MNKFGGNNIATTVGGDISPPKPECRKVWYCA